MVVHFDSQKKKDSSWLLPVLLIIIAIFLAFNFSELELRYRNSKVVTKPDPASYNVSKKSIIKVGSDKKLHGRIFQHFFSQAGSTSGRSPDELSIQFDHPAKIHGILISVDCWKSTRLVEFAAGINQKPAYQTKGDHETLFHVSFATNNTAGKIDEQIWFPEPFKLTPEDSINIGAWIQNVSPDKQSVSPEIIIYYKWQ